MNQLDSAAARRFLLRVLIASLCLTAVVAIVAIIVGEFDETAVNVLLMTLALAFFSVTALVVASVADRAPLLALAGFASSAIGLPVTAALIWHWGVRYTFGRWTAVFVITSLSLAHASALVGRQRETDSAAIRRLTAATLVLIAGVAGMCAIPTALALEDDTSDAYLRAVGVVFVLDVLGTVLVPILRKVQASGPD